MKKIPVKALYEACEMMLRDHWGYIWGTAGVEWTEARQKATENEMAQKYGSRWIGHKVADCSGVMVYIWKQYGLKIAHGSNSIKRQSMGKLSTIPKPGQGALKLRDGDDYYHIGIVAKDGQHVYEAKGTIFGFVVSDVKEWDWFGDFSDVDYEEGQMPDGERVIYRAEVTTKNGVLNVRAGSGTEYPIINKLPKGEIVDVMVKLPNGWLYIDDDGEQGYVDGTYLKPLPPVTAIPDTDDQIPAEDTDPPQIEKYTVLTNADGMTITLLGEWTIKGD